MPLKCLTSLESGKECWIGRGTGSDIVTPHCSISSKHCFLSLQLIPAGNAIDTTEDKTAINDSEEPVELSQPEGEDPLIRTRYIVQCTVTDHSSNGTWLRPRKSKSPTIKLTRNQPTQIKLGDILYLLAPSHSDSKGYRYTLCKGLRKEQLVICQLVTPLKTQTDYTYNEILILDTQKSSLPSNKRKRKEDTVEDTVENSNATKRSCIIEIVPEPEELEKCPHCQQDYPLSQLILHVDNCPSLGASSADENRGPVELGQCIYCNDEYPLTELIVHVENCDQKKDPIPPSPLGDVELEKCIKCFRDYPLTSLIQHTTECTGALLGPVTSERFKNFIPSVHDVDALTMVVLTPVQQKAVDYVQESSKRAAYDEYPHLCTRVVKLGYTPKDLQKVLHWVRSAAPIIIHVNLDRVLHHLVKDTHYRNLFEIGTGGGSCDHSARRGWENNIFNSIYSSSPPSERVKYGVLNIVGDPCGVKSCYSYGDSFLQLKKVRLRTTFASMDTSSSSVKLSCCEHYGNVLNEYTDNELTAILDVATHRKPYLHSNVISQYKEVQIHGPVSLSENVDCIVVNRKYKGNKAIEKLLDQFIDKNNCNLIWMSEAEDPLHLVGVASCYHGDYGHGYYGDDYSDSEEEDYYSDEYYYDENDL